MLLPAKAIANPHVCAAVAVRCSMIRRSPHQCERCRIIHLALTDTMPIHTNNPEIAPRVVWFALPEIASALSEARPYFASFSINFSTMLAGTSS
jgi:hypothetical protein